MVPAIVILSSYQLQFSITAPETPTHCDRFRREPRTYNTKMPLQWSLIDPCSLNLKTARRLGCMPSTAALAVHKVGDMVTAASHVKVEVGSHITDFSGLRPLLHGRRYYGCPLRLSCASFSRSAHATMYLVLHGPGIITRVLLSLSKPMRNYHFGTHKIIRTNI